MVYRFALPDLGEGVAEGTLLAWLVEAGDAVAADQAIAEVGTDKVDVVIPSPVAGVVRSLCVDAGELVPVGTVLAEIATNAGASPDRDEAAATGAERLASRLGVDVLGPPAAAPPSPRGSRVTIARRLTEAASVPTVTNVDAADFDAVHAAGQAPLPVVARATVVALGEHPELNSWGRPDGSRDQRSGVQLGVATQAPSGLVVPVVRDAEGLSAPALQTAISDVTSAAREGRALPNDLRGSTFTITSAGRRAGMLATPLLNLPEVAILGLYRVEQRVVVRDGAVVTRWMANLSVTFDHRAVDGAAAAAFLGRVIELIEAWHPDEP
jgi:pyruvate/2-oxoglutarate dehydrogenase complex dihydrolipoamide acyltransferase (E2) component